MGRLFQTIYDQNIENQPVENGTGDSFVKKYLNTTRSEGINVEPYGQYGFGDSMYDENLTRDQISDSFRDNNENAVEYLRSENQPWSHMAGLGLSRFALTTGTKLAQGAGFVAALPFAGVQAVFDSKEAAAETLFDNFWINAYANLEEDIKSAMPIYKSKKYTEGSLGETIWTPEFFFDDFADGAAFMASALIPGTVLSSLGVVGGTSGIGMRFATSLSKTKLGKLANVSKDLTKIASGIDTGTLALYNTISEAGFEAKGVYDTMLQNGSSKEEAATSAFRTMGLNALVLLGPNAVQQSMFFGRKGLITPEAQLAIRKSIQDKSFKAIEDLFPSLKEKIVQNVGKGLFYESIVEEAGQSAIQKYEEKLQLTKDDWKASELLAQYVDGMFDDKDTQKAMVIGVIMGGFGGVVGGVREFKQDTENVNKIKKVQNITNLLFDKNIKTIYKTKKVPKTKKITNADGKETTVTEQEEEFLLDQNGKPVIDKDKVLKLTRQLVYDKKLIDEASVATILGDEQGAEMLLDLALARSVFNYMSEDDSGIGLEYFKTKLEVEAENQKQLKPEERDGISELLSNKLEQVDEFVALYNETILGEKNQAIGKIKFFEKIKQSSLRRNKNASKESIFKIIEESENFVDSLNEEFYKEQEKLSDEISNTFDKVKELKKEQEKGKTEENSKALSKERSKLDFLVKEYEEAFGNIPLDIITEDEFIRDIKNYQEGLKGEYFSRYGDRKIADIKIKTKLSQVEEGSIDEIEFLTFAKEMILNHGISKEVRKDIDDWFESRTYAEDKVKLESELEALKKSINDNLLDGIPTSKEELNQQSELENLIETLEKKEKQVIDLKNKINDADGFIAKEAIQEDPTDDYFLKKASSNLIDKVFNSIYQNFIKNKEEYSQIGAVIKAIEFLETAVDVYQSRNQDIVEINKLIEKLKSVKETVEKNLRNRKVKQEKFEKNQAENFYKGIGIEITDEGYSIVDKDLYDIIEAVVGKDKMSQILIDAATYEKTKGVISPFPVIHLKVILDIFKDKASADVKNTLVELLNTKKQELQLTHVNIDEFKKAPYKNLQLVLQQQIRVNEDSKKNPYIKFQTSNDPFAYLEDLESYQGDEFYSPVKEIIQDVKNVIKALSYEDVLEYLKSSSKVEDSLESEKKITSDEYKFAPTNQQLYAIRKFFERLSKPKISNFVSYVQGIAGSGKTTVVGDFLVKILGYSQNQILTAAHTNWASNNIKNSITPDGVSRTIDTLHNEIDSILEEQDIKVIILDEVGGMTGEQLNSFISKIKVINEERVKEKKEVISILMMGDPTQIGKSQNNVDPTVYLNNDLNILQAPTLNIVYRSNISSISEASNAFQSNPFTVDGLHVQTNSETNEKTPVGVNRLFSSDDIKSAIKKRIGNGRKKIIIVKDEESKDKYQDVLSSDVVEYEGVSQPEVEILTVQESQGRTIPEVYIDINISITENFANNIRENKLLYTAISRASEYVGIIDYGEWFQENQDSNIINDFARNQKENDDSKEEYEDRIINELSKIYELKGINKPLVKTEKKEDTTTETTIEEESTLTEEDIETKDQEDLSDEEYVVPEVDYEEDLDTSTNTEDDVLISEEDPDLHILSNPTHNNVKVPKNVNEGQLQAAEQAPIGSRVIYVKAIRKGKVLYAILAETNTPGKYTEIGVMDDKELNTTLGREILTNGENVNPINYVFNQDGIILLKNPKILKEGKLAYKKQLTYIYDLQNRTTIADAIKTFINGFFIKAGLVSEKDLEKRMYVRIFSKRDLRGENQLPVVKKANMTIQPGIPYLVIENPKSKNKKSNTESSPQFIRLLPKKLSKNNKLLAPVLEYRNLVNELEKHLPFKLGDKKFSIYISKFIKDYSIDESDSVPKIVPAQEENRTQYRDVADMVSEEIFDKTKNIVNKIIPLIYGPESSTKLFTEEEYNEFVKTSSLEEKLIEKVPIKNSNKFRVRYKVNETDIKSTFVRETKLIRGKGVAQHNFNAIARANSSIRIKKNIPSSIGKYVTTIFGKSLLDDRESDGAYRKYLHEIILNHFEKNDIKDEVLFVTKSKISDFEDFILMNDLSTKEELDSIKEKISNKPITSTKLDELFGDEAFDEEGNHSFRTPINSYTFNSIASKPGSLSTKQQQDEAFEQLDKIVDSNLKQVIPTSATVSFPKRPEATPDISKISKKKSSTDSKKTNTKNEIIDVANQEQESKEEIKNAIDELNDFFNPLNLEMPQKNSTFAEEIKESENAEEIKKNCKK